MSAPVFHRLSSNSIILTLPWPGLITSDSPTTVLTDALAEKAQKALQARLMDKLATISRKLSRYLRQNQGPYKKYVYRKFWISPQFGSWQFVCLHIPPFVCLPTETDFGKWNRLVQGTYGSFQFFHITEHTVTVKEDISPIMISCYPAISVALSIEYPCLFNMSKSFSNPEKLPKRQIRRCFSANHHR